MTASQRPARTRTLSCPNCGGNIELKASGISISAICPSCGSTIDVANPDLKVIAAAQQNTRRPPLPIGARGTLVGTEWEVIGWQVRSSVEEGAWDEYLLFNPYRGFRFLAHDAEGWSLFAMLRRDVQPPGPPESASTARTDYVLGEFYWRVRVGDTAEVKAYQSGSHVLLQERTGDEIVWSRGAPLSDVVMRTAFGAAATPEVRAAKTERATTIEVLQIGLTAVLLLFVLSLVPFGRNHSLLVYQQGFTTTAAEASRMVSSAPFDIPDDGGNVQIELQSPVQDDWVELSLTLSRQPGGPTFTARRTLEYYSGYDSDGSWEEGNQSTRLTFASVPGGTYQLLVGTDAGAHAKTAPRNADPTTVSFAVAIRRHVPAAELFWLALIALITYPAYRLIFRRGLRMMRPPRLFALFCLLVLLGFGMAKYRGVTLFGSPSQAASSYGSSNYSSGSSGSHK